MIARYILALDPSGAYQEGKGTTGWCLFDQDTDKIVKYGVIKAEDYSCQFQYWDAHIKLIDSLAGFNMDVVIEDYLLYSDRANNQINSRLETPQLLGIIKYEAYKRGLFIYIQPAMLVKKRWSNETLAYKGYVKAEARGKVSIAGRTVVTHIQDSIRHAIHYKTYVSKYKSKGVRR